jgi:hypothetical protein
MLRIRYEKRYKGWVVYPESQRWELGMRLSKRQAHWLCCQMGAWPVDWEASQASVIARCRELGIAQRLHAMQYGEFDWSKPP